MSDILILGEHSAGKLKKYSMELAGQAAIMSQTTGGTVAAVLFGDNLQEIAKELGKFGVKKIITVSHPDLEYYSAENYTKVLTEIIQAQKPAVVLATASALGKDLLARVAAKLNAGLATDCIELKLQDGKLLARRPIYAGKVIIDVEIESNPQLATVRPNIFPLPGPQSLDPEITSFTVNPGAHRAKVKEITEAEAGMVDLTEAERIVSGGRAMGQADNFKLLKELAQVIGASVGASRAAVDAGYISHDHQVGQTGKTVNPTLYIAAGISGAIQHLAGMRTSKVIVAINKDPEAPIFSKADYGIVGDLFKVIPALTKEFKKVLQE